VADIPPEYRDLVERPIFASLGTVRPDGTVQVNPMWFGFDGEHLRFSHTTKRAKFRNLQANPSMSLLIVDPDQPERYLELRGKLVELGRRYGNPDQQPPADKADRVVLVMQIDRALAY
jgi:PPOX class probable F420-dependent enzyme